MPNLKVDDFKGQLTGGGARSNLFDVNITFPAFAGGDTELTNFMCRSASLPSSTLGQLIVPFRGRQIKLAGDRTFETWTITVYNDTNFAVRDSFESWMNGINGHESNSGLTDPIAYQADLNVRQLDKDGSVLKTYNFRGAFPTSVGQIALTYDEVSAIEEFEVTLDYQYWTSNTTS
jgi:hypothetical protein